MINQKIPGLLQTYQRFLKSMVRMYRKEYIEDKKKGRNNRHSLDVFRKNKRTLIDITKILHGKNPLDYF